MQRFAGNGVEIQHGERLAAGFVAARGDMPAMFTPCLPMSVPT